MDMSDIEVDKTSANSAVRAKIARLTRELEEARRERDSLEDRYNDLDIASSTLRERLIRERDEARQALEAERARVAELEKLIDEEAEHDTLCGSNRLRQDPCDCWKSKALAAKGGEVSERELREAARALAATGWCARSRTATARRREGESG